MTLSGHHETTNELQHSSFLSHSIDNDLKLTPWLHLLMNKSIYLLEFSLKPNAFVLEQLFSLPFPSLSLSLSLTNTHSFRFVPFVHCIPFNACLVMSRSIHFHSIIFELKWMRQRRHNTDNYKYYTMAGRPNNTKKKATSASPCLTYQLYELNSHA